MFANPFAFADPLEFADPFGKDVPLTRWSTAWVFGGSQGIGRAVAEALAAGGSRVAIFARRPEPLEAAALEISAHAGGDGSAQAFPADVEDALGVAAACDKAAATFGPPRLVVNCAGRARPRRFVELTVEDLRATLRANLEGAWNVSQAALPHLTERGGTLVHTASLAGLIGVYGYSDYAASKAGLIALCEVLRQELEPKGVDVRVLCPPDVDTPGFSEENRSKPRETRLLSGSGGLLTAREVAGDLLKGLEGSRWQIVPGRTNRLAVRLKGIAPGLVDRLLRARLRRLQRQD